MKTVNSKNWTAEDVEEVLKLIDTLNIQSLNKEVIREEGDTPVELGDFVQDYSPGPQEIVEDKDAKERLIQIVNKLSPRDAQIIKLRYGLVTRQPLTLEEIGRLYGVTRERIRQIELKALRKLKWLITVKHKCRDINDF